jgi:predicted  nucleic acid-binding Zn-ribbon protein
VAIAGDGVFRLNGEAISDWSDLVRLALQADGRRFIEICIAAEKDNRP